ncbi:MAG: hypothetical protein Q7U69_08740 [Sulfuricurvum sp.]|uniref:hypothetical protein n=1 Tax=Sulfuricurvum sp. TaxID=2025608 RepID=UPI00271957E8|nr:hypothetical protein [Sulfuricurvum sp.]MDO9056622.1 hypothetical protein [Sulfuricurvum sp.]
MREKALFSIIIGINFLILLLQIQGLSIGYHEAQILYGDFSPLQFLISSSLHFFGQNDYALRVPMIVLHLFSVVLLYAISKHYVSREGDRLWIVLIYTLLPGVTSAALVVDNAGLVIVSLFLFGYLHLNYGRYALGLLPFLIAVDPAFAYLFFAIALYGAYRKEYLYIVTGTVALVVSLSFYGIHIGGSPESRFLDALGVYTAIFSPIVFLYLFYVLYRRMIAKEWDLIWMIAMSAFMISLLLSFRQKVEVQTFAPFLLLALPLAAQTFFHTYRIRLREFRGRYRILFYSAFALLVINVLAVFFNHYFYRFLSNPTRHFSYPMHVAKELSGVLHHENIQCVDAGDVKLQLRLRFYEITQCNENRLESQFNPYGKKVTISYINTLIYETYVTKVNK